MTTPDEAYRRCTLAQLKGRKVKTLRELRNGYLTIPKGAELTIVGKHSGYGLRGDPCPQCGVQVHISKVDGYALEFI